MTSQFNCYSIQNACSRLTKQLISKVYHTLKVALDSQHYLPGKLDTAIEK